MSTIKEVVEECVSNRGKFQSYEASGVTVCGYGMMLPCKYQGVPYAALVGSSVIIPCVYRRNLEVKKY